MNLKLKNNNSVFSDDNLHLIDSNASGFLIKTIQKDNIEYSKLAFFRDGERIIATIKSDMLIDVKYNNNIDNNSNITELKFVE